MVAAREELARRWGAEGLPSFDLGVGISSGSVKPNQTIKAMHREVMLSAAYQLSVEQNEGNVSKDPDNRLCWRF